MRFSTVMGSKNLTQEGMPWTILRKPQKCQCAVSNPDDKEDHFLCGFQHNFKGFQKIQTFEVDADYSSETWT